MEVEDAKLSLVRLLNSMDNDEKRREFVDWMRKDIASELVNREKNEDLVLRRKRLRQIAEYAKSLQGNFDAIRPTEDVRIPANSDEFEPGNFAHVDAFLYDDADVEELTFAKRIPRHVCNTCGSHDTTDVTLITHSCSRDDVEFMFDVLLPADVSGRSLLDVGSRLGAVVFGAATFSNFARLRGIEMNPELVAMANETAARFFDPADSTPIEFVCSELTTRPDVVSDADVVVLNNVFDWFAPVDAQVLMWNFLRDHVRPGSILVTIPPIDRALAKLPRCAGIDAAEWVAEMPPNNPGRMARSQIDEHMEEMRMYRVLAR